MSRLALALSTATSLAALAIGLDRLDYPSVEFWEGKTGWVLAALFLTTFPNTFQAYLVERGERSRRKALEKEAKIRVILMTSLVDLATNCGLDWKAIGVRAFSSKRTWGWRWRPRYTHHVRIGLIKLNSGPASGINWINGKGVVGQCWATNGERQFDDFGDYSDHTEASWMALSAAERYELTFSELKVMRERYGVVAAVPILTGTKYIGCVTMDTEPSPATVPERQQVWHSLGVTAALVKGVLAD